MSKISKREKALLTEALAQPPARRAAFLAQAAGTDAALQARLLRLVAGHEAAGNVLDAVPIRRTGVHEDEPESLIDRYKLLRKIGEGGCGVVWLAEQQQPVRRRVALKLIKLGMDTKAVLARFEAERQALAIIDHPNIARLLDAGTSGSGRPFFVMEWVRGKPITEFCDEHQLTPERRVRLFITVCHAVQHAHQQAIIHRDLKPANVLVALQDGNPTPKVIDFGIAKATQGRLSDATLFTVFEQFIGTPAYMSPEQAAMGGSDIDARSDIYSLGVLLYELLTGQPLFDRGRFASADIAEIRQLICDHAPPRPSTRLRSLGEAERSSVAQRRGLSFTQLASQLRGDLDWIIMKCLEKDRTRRYATADELSRDLERHLAHAPITARPPQVAYLLRKSFQRHRFGTLAAVALAITLGIGAGEALRATRAERRQTEFRDAAAKAVAQEQAARRAAAMQREREAGIRWARDTALPEIARLIQRDDLSAAFELACEAEDHIRHDPALARLWPELAATVAIETMSAEGDAPQPVEGAEISIKPYRKPDSDWQYLGRTPLQDVRLARDVYRWRIRREGYAPLEQAAGWHLFYWGNPTKLVFRLEPAGSTPPGMVRVERRTMSPVNATPLPGGQLDDFWIDRFEVTNREFKAFVDAGGYATERFWTHAFVKENNVLPWKEAMRLLRDRTGQPGPASWKDGTYLDGEAEYPVTGVSWYEAAAYASFVGKRLPSIYHWQNAAAIMHGAFLVPLSNFNGRGLAPVGQYQGMSRFGAYDMAGNAEEWCSNPTDDGARYILGGGWRDPIYMFEALQAKPAFDRSPLNGFRCISAEPLLPPVVDAPLSKPPMRDFSREKPIDDNAFNECRR